MPFLDETGLEQVLNGIKDNTLPFTEDLVFDEDKKLTAIVMGNVQSNIDENGWVWTETDSYTPVDDNEYANDTSNADYIYEYKPAQIEYSTNEVDTGNKWIDGKPIYRIALNWSGTATKNTSFSVSNLSIEYPINLYGIAGFIDSNTQYYITLPDVQTTAAAGVPLMYNQTAESINVGSTSSTRATLTYIHLILEYTKTTDTV